MRISKKWNDRQTERSIINLLKMLQLVIIRSKLTIKTRKIRNNVIINSNNNIRTNKNNNKRNNSN